MFLCTQIVSGSPVYSEVTASNLCTGYIQEQAINFGITSFSYSEANAVLGATALLFTLAFIFRFVLSFIKNR